MDTLNIQSVNENFEDSNTVPNNSMCEFNNVVLGFKNIDEAIRCIDSYSFCESLTISKKNRINIKVKTSNLLLLFNQLSKDNLFYISIDIVKCDA